MMTEMLDGLAFARIPAEAGKWLLPAGTVALYSRNTGFFKTERWLFSAGICIQTKLASLIRERKKT